MEIQYLKIYRQFLLVTELLLNKHLFAWNRKNVEEKVIEKYLGIWTTFQILQKLCELLFPADESNFQALNSFRTGKAEQISWSICCCTSEKNALPKLITVRSFDHQVLMEGKIVGLQFQPVISTRHFNPRFHPVISIRHFYPNGYGMGKNARTRYASWVVSGAVVHSEC